MATWGASHSIMTEIQGDIPIRTWLGTSEAQTVIQRAARQIVGEVGIRSLSLNFLQKDFLGQSHESEMLDDVVSELSLFILEKAVGWRDRFQPQHPHAHLYLKKAFISHWISMTRRADRDPRRHVYRRVQMLLRQAPGFFTRSDKNQKTAFSRVEKNGKIPRLLEDDLAEIPFPLVERNYECINRKSVLLFLARHFWDQVSGMWKDRPVWVDLRDFTRWLERFVYLGGAIREGGGVYDDDPLERLPHPGPGPDQRPVDPERIRRMARRFAEGLDSKEKTIFFMIHKTDAPLREVALAVGYKGSSGPKYALDRIHERLGTFLREDPAFAQGEMDRDEAFSLFFNTLLSILKNRDK